MTAIRGAVLLVILLLSGCSTKGPLQPETSAESRQLWDGRQAELTAIQNWDIKGRLAVRTRDDGGSATILWDRRGPDHRIELYGPFGGGRINIEQSADSAILRDNRQNVVEDLDAEAVLYRRLGWHVPFNALEFWIRGLPAPGDHGPLGLDASGRIMLFEQAGWRIDVRDYISRQGFDLPRKLFIKALPGTVHLVDDDGTDLGEELEVKVVVKRWLVEDS